MQYKVRAASIATGISADRLRTWERRYGIPMPARTPTGRRLYDEDDLAVIGRLAALIESGLSAASAAATVQREAVPVTSILPARASEIDSRVLSLVDSAETFDEEALLEILIAAKCSMGIEAAVEEIALPALIEVGNRWQRATMSTGGEHLLSEVVRSWLGGLSRALPSTPASAPRVVVACPEDEHHDIGALALTLFLRREGLRVAYFGADMPTGALMEVVRSGAFAALCLSVTAFASLPTARIALGGLIEGGDGMLMYVGGRAISRARDGEADAIPAMRLSESVVAAARQVAIQLVP